MSPAMHLVTAVHVLSSIEFLGLPGLQRSGVSMLSNGSRDPEDPGPLNPGRLPTWTGRLDLSTIHA